MTQQANTPTVCYDVTINPMALEIAVEMTITGAIANGDVIIQIPTWVPGDYSFEAYGRDIFSLSANNAGESKPLIIERKGFNQYLIKSCSQHLVIRYSASCYEPELGDAMGLVDSEYTILLGTRYLYTPAHLGPCQVTYHNLPKGWGFHHPSGAQQIEQRPSWIYPSYELLLDTPVVFGNFTLIKRDIHNTPFYFVFVDQGIGFEQTVHTFVDQLCIAVDKTYDIFHQFPFNDYTFFLSLNPQADWGLEHLTSNMSGLGPNVFIDPDQFANGIRVCTHELFHAWNVRRLRPAPLGQLSSTLDCGCFTEGLWMAEGFTRYYEFLISTRAKAYSPTQFFSAVANYYQHLSQQPAYKRVSATDSSLATYMNHAKYPGRVNNSIDYYDKGMLIAFGLDADLRMTFNDTLDNAFSDFYQTFFGPSQTVPADYIGYSTQDVIDFFNQRHAGLGSTIEQQITQPAPLDTPEKFRQLGLTPEWQEGFYLGLFFMNNADATIYGVCDTSAASKVGIAPGDIILCVNHYAFSPQALKWAANQVTPVVLTVRRGHRELMVTLSPQPIQRLTKLRWQGNEDQRQHIGQWLDDDAFCPAPESSFELDFYENFHGIETLI